MSKYWSERQKQLWDNLERDEQALQRKLNKYYSEQFNRLEKEIGTYYSRYGEGNVIQYQSLLKSLGEADKKQLYRDFESFATRYPEYANLADVRGSIYKLNRLNGLAYNIQLQQLEIGAKEQELISKHLGGVFSDFYTGAAKAHNFPIDKFSAQSLINKKWANASNFSESIWGNKDKLIAYLNHDFKNGIIRGDNYQKLIKQLRDRFSKRSTSDLRRLVVTEGTYVANQAMMQPFEESGLYDEFKFVALIDRRTSPTCRSLEGQTFKMSEKEVGVNFPPMHPNCRSTFEMVIPEDFVDRYEEGGKKSDEKPYHSVKEEWLNRSGEGSLSDLHFWEHEGKKYYVDGKYVVLDYSQKEKEVANWIAQKFGKEVQMAPKVHVPQLIKSPDYLIDGARFDLKEISGIGKNVIDGVVKEQKKQADNFVFDVSKTQLSYEQIIERIDRLYHHEHRKWVNTIILIKNNELLDIFKRK